jgi:hypothetical protein
MYQAIISQSGTPGKGLMARPIKRQMFGRAGLPLLRKRVLLTAQNQ